MSGRPTTGLEVRGVRLHPDILEAIDRMAEANQVTRAAVIRHLVALGLTRQRVEVRRAS